MLGTDPDILNGKKDLMHSRKKTRGNSLGAGTLDGRKGDMNPGTWDLQWVPQSWLLLLKPRHCWAFVRVIQEGLEHPLTSVKHQGPWEIGTSWGTSFSWFTVKTKWQSWCEWWTHTAAPPSRSSTVKWGRFQTSWSLNLGLSTEKLLQLQLVVNET